MIYKILIFDDNQIELTINNTYIQTFVSMYKLRTEIVALHNAREVIKHGESRHIDIAFLDINKSEGEYSGIKLAGHILKRSPDAVIIFVTGEIVTITEVFNVRAFDYVLKPIDSEKIRTAFVRAIKQASLVNNKVSTTPLIITVDNLKKKIRQANISYTTIQKDFPNSNNVVK